MKVLITGGAGFIGSHLSEAMLQAGHTVTALDDLSTGALSNIEHLRTHPQFRFVQGSVCDESAMRGEVEICDIVYHLAAAVGVQLIVKRPVHTISTNIHGTEVVLELANTFRKQIVIASSSEVYGKSLSTPFQEDADVVLGSTRFSRWSYACSKMIDEFLALAYHEQFKLQAIVCRFFNTIGPRQTGDYGMVVPRFVRRALRNEPLEIFGTGEQTRCFCHVADVVGALKALLDCAAAVGEVINIGSTELISIKNLATKIIRMTGSKSPISFIPYEKAYGRPFDDMLERRPDLGKAKQLLGYEPSRGLEDTLQEVIAYERGRLGP
ncbi:MAG TPA: GDP-mannose 4,6-dehydratase [Candidatus Dormibacteraeota bacterium]|nr:GDP-mannose 4,6-dehydratase [Candidatus Dormibacteraeota bacterium]